MNKINVYPQQQGFGVFTFEGIDVPKECIQITLEQYDKLVGKELMWSNKALIPSTQTQEDIDETLINITKEQFIQERNDLRRELVELKYDIEQVDNFHMVRDLTGKRERCAEIIVKLKQIKEFLGF